ncbi:serine hydrolase [Bradyrhizobium sp. BR 10261]|uniref:serine hydrolase domain-containing protein n=1 Tax=Bradyrhizobium sp. BR 10261 TaxID=2749992 RepID=UPI001C64EC8C|nr:serine hydrolase [Bradyrhizobium sp. BR 10261]MBW7967156.1 serine hydrolase [Bradyrhizobium sp. BR 10261]
MIAFAIGGEVSPECGRPSDVHDGWRISSPEQQGLDAGMLCAMGKGVVDGKLPNVDSIVVVRHGAVVYERYFNYPNHSSFDATVKHDGNSMTKSVVSLLVGIAMDRGLIDDLDASIFSYFPEYASLRTPAKDRITLRNLLTMSAGLNSTLAHPILHHDRDPYRHALEQSLARAPGVAFEYNGAATELIGAVLQKASGKPVDALARENIFEPLGINDVDWHGRLSNGVPTSSTGLSLRPRDWAKIGQLVLNRGAWQGKQIVPASWIAQSTAEQIKGARKPLSYGFQWWLGRSRIEGRVVEWIAAMGFNAQKVVIVPGLDMIVVFNASLESVQMVAPEIQLLDKYILPALSKD